MGLSCARQGDMVFGVCYNHGCAVIGTILNGASKSNIENLKIAQLSNLVLFS